MASYSVTTAKHATLTASTVDTITITDDKKTNVEILNRSSSDYLYAGVGSTPTVAGDNTYVIAPNGSLTLPLPSSGPTRTVSLISSGAAAYSVTAA